MKRFRGFLDIESREVPELDKLRLEGIDPAELLERVVQREDVERVVSLAWDLFQTHACGAAAAFVSETLARVIHKDATHHVCSYSEELSAILPVSSALIDEAEIRLVNQRGRLKGMAVRFPAHCVRGDTAQLVVYERYELIRRSTVALTPRLEERSDVRPCGMRKM